MPPNTARPALRFVWPPTFNTDETVVEPRTASEVEVAPWSEVSPVIVSEESESVEVWSVPTLSVEIVDEPFIVSDVPVALAKKSGPVSVVEAEVSEVAVALLKVAPPLNAITVVVAFDGNG